MIRKKVLIAGALVIAAVVFGSKIVLYQKYRYPSEEFYGKKLYSEVVYHCSYKEKAIGKALVGQAVKISQYEGTEQEAENEIGYVGALEEYYLFQDKKAIAQEMTFQLITCKINGDDGHVWVVYTSAVHRNDGTTGYSTDILTLWDIENQGGRWVVTRIIEAP